MQQSAYGFNLMVSTNLDLSTATDLRVDVLKPDGTRYQIELGSAAFIAPIAPDTNWLVKVPVQSGHLSISGTYQIQVTDTTSGRNMPCSIGKFNVLPNIPTS